MNAAETIAAAIEKLATTDEPPIGSIVIHAEGGWPWVRTAGGKWTRDAGRTFLSWVEVYAWHQHAVDDPDDETVEPFRPVVLNYGNDKPLPLIDAQLAILRNLHKAVETVGESILRDPRSPYPKISYDHAFDLARAILGEALS